MTKSTSKKENKVDIDSVEVIHWRDALSDHGWSETRETELAEVMSVGFLVAEDRKAVCIATTWAEPESNGRMNIPKGWITKRYKVDIREKEEVLTSNFVAKKQLAKLIVFCKTIPNPLKKIHPYLIYPLFTTWR